MAHTPTDERADLAPGAERIYRCPEPGCSAELAGARIVAHHSDGSHTAGTPSGDAIDSLRPESEMREDILRLTWAQTHRVECDDLTDEAVLRLALDVPKLLDALRWAVDAIERLRAGVSS